MLPAMADPSSLPPCGVYRTQAPIGTIPEGRLVYFHNHGEPGPGLYLPASWKGNRARFEARGHLLPTPGDVQHLEPLRAEGLYRVVAPFHCCDKECQLFAVDALVQLGYDGQGNAIVFTPEWVDGAIALPERGTRVESDRLDALKRLHIPITDSPVHAEGADDMLLH